MTDSPMRRLADVPLLQEVPDFTVDVPNARRITAAPLHDEVDWSLVVTLRRQASDEVAGLHALLHAIQQLGECQEAAWDLVSRRGAVDIEEADAAFPIKESDVDLLEGVPLLILSTGSDIGAVGPPVPELRQPLQRRLLDHRLVDGAHVITARA